MNNKEIFEKIKSLSKYLDIEKQLKASLSGYIHYTPLAAKSLINEIIIYLNGKPISGNCSTCWLNNYRLIAKFYFDYKNKIDNEKQMEEKISFQEDIITESLPKRGRPKKEDKNESKKE